MAGLDDLYQEVVIDHNNQPRNFRRIEDASCSLEGYNPLCGDRLTVYLVLQGDLITDVGFVGSGCAISRASSSMMTECVKGRTVAEVARITGLFRNMVTSEPGTYLEPDEDLGDMEALAGVSQFPARVKCATLAWHTLMAALDGKGESISTE